MTSQQTSSLRIIPGQLKDVKYEYPNPTNQMPDDVSSKQSSEPITADELNMNKE
jgi:hypothetical protein